MNKKIRRAIWLLFILYCIVMIYLLFLMRAIQYGYVDLTYKEILCQNLNLEPLATIRGYNSVMTYDFVSFTTAVSNVLGNVILFIPFGAMLPTLFISQRKYYKTMITSFFIISGVELTQLFTTVGSCDIDDLILNLMGVTIGYIFFALPIIRRWVTGVHKNK